MESTLLSSVEALTWNGWGNVDAAIVDYAMPIVDGHHVMAFLATEYPYVYRILHTARPVPTLAPHAVSLSHWVVSKSGDSASVILRGLEMQSAQLQAA